MNPAICVAELCGIADERIWRTNPVWCLDRLVERWKNHDASLAVLPYRLASLLEALDRLGICVPKGATDHWAEQCGPLPKSADRAAAGPPCPGVVGLVVDLLRKDTWVVPLAAERSAEWNVEPTLPFRSAGTLQDLLLAFLQGLGLPHVNGVPERFAFALKDPLGMRSEGPSMDIAGLLAIIREANGRPEGLDRACAVVQPSGDDLVPVGSISVKLDAFIRECGTGTLLVRCRGCNESEAYDRHFDAVWEVDSLSSLAKKCEGSGWLAAFLDGQPLSAEDAGTVSARIRNIQGGRRWYAQALDLCSRAERCQFGPDVPFRVRREFRQSLIDLSRHLGDYQTSLDLAEEGRRLAGTAKASSYEDRVQADLDYAAALFAPHRFQDIHDLLDPWRVKLTADPLLVTPILRTKVFNTLGRALAAVGRDGWEELFCCAAQIMEEIEPTDLPRTLIYLAQSYLRNGQLTNATAVLARIEDDPSLDETSRWFLCNVQADAARRRGEIWVDPEMEQAEVSRRVGHPFAYYFQATARQPGRDTADSLGRFRRAREFFGQDLPGRDARNIQCFLIACIELAEAAWASDQDGWNESLSRLQRHVAPTPGLALSEHYNGYLPAPGSTPTQKAAERLLSRVPFF